MWFEITVREICAMFTNEENQKIKIWSDNLNDVNEIIWEGNAEEAIYSEYANKRVSSIDNIKMGTDFVTLNIIDT